LVEGLAVVAVASGGDAAGKGSGGAGGRGGFLQGSAWGAPDR